MRVARGLNFRYSNLSEVHWMDDGAGELFVPLHSCAGSTTINLMSSEVAKAKGCEWFSAGNDMFPAMLGAIGAAGKSVDLETYIFAPGPLGLRFVAALTKAVQRGVRVRVLVDALGSADLPGDYWHPLVAAGGEVRQFNPLALRRFGIRNHRKLLVCDGNTAFLGGFNIAPEYEGDGVSSGWCDLGLRVEGELVPALARSFEEMFSRAEFLHRRILPLRNFGARKMVLGDGSQLLLSGPGRVMNPIKRALREDLAHAVNVQIMAAYFLPSRRLRGDLAKVVHRGGTVEVMLGGKSDVPLSRLAAQSLYRRMLSTGLRVLEYQPQVLHAKLIIIDGIIYVGSANLDQRSLNINYELLVRLQDPVEAARARQIFEERRKQCHEITREHWKRSWSLWGRLKQRWAYFLLVRVDPLVARWQLRGLPD